MTRIVHISDLHFGREQPGHVAALERQVHALRPDLVVASGDLTQRARRHEMAAAVAFVERLPRPVLVVPGNHDIPGVTPKRFIDPWRRWRDHFAGGLEPVIEGEDFIAVGANSTRRWGPYLDWSRGRLGHAQIDRLAARVRTGGPRLRILAAHHPLLLTAAGAGRGLVGRGALALTRLRAAGLDLALGGHVHMGYAGIANGIVIAHAGTAVSDRLAGEPNGFNLITGDRAALVVEHWTWGGAAYAAAASTRFARGDGGWGALAGSR